MKASVIISDVNSQGMLIASVYSTITQDLPCQDFEILLPINNEISFEDLQLLRAIQSEHSNLHLVDSTGSNRSQSINNACKLAKGDILLFTESHCLAPRNWIRKFVEQFKDKKIKLSLGTTISVASASPVSIAESKQQKQSTDNSIKLGLDKSYFDFHNCAIRKDSFWELNGLNEEIPIFAEFDFGARAVDQGRSIKKSNGTVLHFNDTSLARYSLIISAQGENKMKLYLQKDEKYIRRYFPMPKLIRFKRILVPFRRSIELALIFLKNVWIIGFVLTVILNMPSAQVSFFRQFAIASHRLGTIKALSKTQPRKRK